MFLEEVEHLDKDLLVELQAEVLEAVEAVLVN
jgi:hypothetical protein